MQQHKGSANILVLAGHGGKAFGDKETADIVSGFESCGANVSSIKHDHNEQTLKDVEKSVRSMLENGKPLTVWVQAHGSVEDRNHVLHLGETEKALRSRDLFESIARGSDGRPVDVFLTACHGGAALNDVGCLPKGSSIAVLAPPDETVSGSDVDRFSPSMSNVCRDILSESNLVHAENLSARKLLDVYLSKSLKNRIAPMFATSGSDIINLDSNFRNQVGKQFTSDQYKQSHGELDRILGPKQVDDIMQKITSAKHESDGIYAADYGPALAVIKTSKESHLQPPLLSEQGLRKLDVIGPLQLEVDSEVQLLPANRSINTPTQTQTAVSAAAAAAPLAAFYVYQSAANLSPDHWLHKAVFNNPVRKAFTDVSNFAKNAYRHGFSPTQANEQGDRISADADSGQNRGIEKNSQETLENTSFSTTKSARESSEHSHIQSRDNAEPKKLRNSGALTPKSPGLIGKTLDNTSVLRNAGSQKTEPNRSSTPLAR